MKTKMMIAIITIAIVFTNCKKDAGPKGEKGDKGESGINGVDGLNGSNGTNGNANVTSILLNANTWTWNSAEYYRYAFWNNISILTQSVLDGGAVMLYQKVNNTYYALPLSFNSGATEENDYFAYDLNAITIFKENSDLTDPNPVATVYKLVCIPPAMIKPNVDMENYAEVKTAYHLQD